MTTATTGSEETEPSQRPQKRRGVSWRGIAAGFVLFLAALAASLFFAPPSGFFTALVQRAVHDATGRELTVSSSRYVIRETVTVEFDGVALGRPGGEPGTALFTARKIRATVPLRSVLARKLDLKTLDLDAPVVNLVREASGTTNWTAPSAGATGTPQDLAAILALPPTTIRNGTLVYRDDGSDNQLRLDAIDARLAVDPRYGGAAAQGSLRYNAEPLAFGLTLADAAAAFAGRATAVTLALDGRVLKAKLAGQGRLGELPMLAGEIEAMGPSARDLAAWLGFADSVPATARAFAITARTDAAGATTAAGTLDLAGTTATYDLTLADLSAALAGRPSAVRGRIGGADLAADIDGRVVLGGDAAYDGRLAARSDKVGEVARRLGITNAAVTRLGAGSLTGQAKITSGGATFESASFNGDGRTGTFAGDIRIGGPRPRITGDLTLSRLDLDALLGRPPRPPASLAAEARDSGAGDADAGVATSIDAGFATSIDAGFATTFDALAAELDAIEAPQPKVFGLEAATAAGPAPGWNTTPIDLTALRAADLDLNVRVDAISFGGLDLRAARIAAKLDNGALAARIDEIGVGAGKGTGAIDLKARGTDHDAAVALTLTGVEAEPLTTELSGKPLLKGLADVTIATRATGRSLDRLVATLDGNVRFDMRKGQLRGWDIGAMVAELWNYKGWGYNARRNTPVDRLTATYAIKAGTVRSAPDLTLAGPTAGLRSVGSVVVPQRLIDQTVKVENLFFNIVVKGDWTKTLWIGPAFLAGLTPAVPGAAVEAPPAAQLPRALPSDLKLRIEKILDTAELAARLSPQQKALLQAFVAAGSGS